MYSAKQIYLGKRVGVWCNPYITDGLVAMWDGEWNAGPGVHDPGGDECRLQRNDNCWDESVRRSHVQIQNPQR